MMKHIIRGLTFLLIPILVNGILGFMRQPQKAEKGKVYLHKFLAILGIICTTVLLIPAIIIAFLDESLWISAIFLVFAAFSTSMIVGFINCRISYDEEGFVAKNFFGIKRKFTYDQVTAIKENLHESYIYMGQRRVMVDQLAVGGDDFIKLVKKKYRTMHDGQSLPKVHKMKNDIFRGNVSNAGEFVFFYILLGVILLSLLGFVIYSTYFSPSTTTNTTERAVRFISYATNEGEVVLTSTDKQIYVIRFIDEQFNSSDIQAICDGKTVVTAYFNRVKPKYEAPYYALSAIAHEGTYLLSFEETNRLFRQENTTVVIVVLVMCLIWGAYIAGSIMVGRNPRKFSKRFVQLFFKDGYVNY